MGADELKENTPLTIDEDIECLPHPHTASMVSVCAAAKRR
jgi:hypothetical protein